MIFMRCFQIYGEDLQSVEAICRRNVKLGRKCTVAIY